MADYDSSLPARTEAAGDIDVFVSDATISTQKLKVNADGSIDTNTTLPTGTKVEITDGTDDLEVNADGSINAVVSATDLDIRDLDASQDNVAISDGTDTLAVNADGSINATVSATDLDIRDLSAAQDSVEARLHDDSGAAYTNLNPLPVSVESTNLGDKVCEYNTSAAVAKDASVNHDYTVTAGKTFSAAGLWVSGSGKLKAEILINGATTWVGFNSTSNPNIDFPVEKVCEAAATQVVRIAITNRDNQAQDVYSTLTGQEV